MQYWLKQPFKIVPIIEDARSQSKDGLTAYKKLVDVNKVQIIVGDVLSSTTMAIVPMLEKDKVLLFAPGASNPKLKGALNDPDGQEADAIMELMNVE